MLSTILTQALPTWEFAGPAPILGGNGEGINPTDDHPFGSDPVSGAVQSIAVDPDNPNRVFVGTVNGGVWRTSNFSDTNPDWTPLSDALPNLSIGAVAINPTIDPSPTPHRTIFAGIGRHSNGGGDSSLGGGVYRSTDGGDSWQYLGRNELGFADINSIAFIESSTSTLLVSAREDNQGLGTGGVYRSTDNGQTWTRTLGTNLFDAAMNPRSDASQVVADYVDNVYYAAVPFVGIFRSADGATWTPVNSGLSGLANSDRISLAVNSDPSEAGHAVFAAIIGSEANSPNNKVLRSMYISRDMGQTWTQFSELPETRDPIELNGLHPGGQGIKNFSMVADPQHPNVVYVGGDRQPVPVTNEALCTDFSGRIFRGEFRDGDDPEWEQVVCRHADANGILPGGNSAPHADSRVMVFHPNGSILEGDDGGIYVLFNPNDDPGTHRHWESRVGDLAVTEIYSLAYNSELNEVLIGAQDNGSAQGLFSPAGPAVYEIAIGGDGQGQAAVVDGDHVTEYLLGNNYRSFYRQEGPGEINLALDFVHLAPAGKRLSLPRTRRGLSSGDRQVVKDGDFVTIPYAVNEFEPNKLVIGYSDLYESKDRGDHISVINSKGGKFFITAVAYGSADNHDALYFARGWEIFSRPAPGTTLRSQEIAGHGSRGIFDLVIDPENGDTAYAIDTQTVLQTTDGGQHWNVILNVGSERALTSLEIVKDAGQTALLVGTSNGVLRTLNPSQSSAWAEYGLGLPNAAVSDLHYDAVDDILFAATYGRGVWAIENVSTFGQIDRLSEIEILGTGNVDKVVLVRDAGDRGKVAVFLDNATTPAARVPLAALHRISFTGFGGSDILVVDSARGVVDVGVFNTSIEYFAGEDAGDNDRLEATGGAPFFSSPDVLQGQITVPDTVYLSDLAPDSGRHESVNINSFGLETVVDVLAKRTTTVQKLGTIRQGAKRTSKLTASLSQAETAAGDCPKLPLLGCQFDQFLKNSGQPGLTPTHFPDPAEATTAGALRQTAISPGIPLLDRVLGAGQTPLSLDEIGVTIQTFEDLAARLDALDSTPNVSMTLDPATGLPTYEVQANVRLTGVSGMDFAALGGLAELSGLAEVSADVAIDITLGLDERGFFVDLDNATPEFVVSGFSVSQVDGFGRLGLLQVNLDGGMLAVDSNARLTLDLINPGPDPLESDAIEATRLREYELDADVASLVRAAVVGDPGDGEDDLTFTGQFSVSAFGLEIADAQLRFTWPEFGSLAGVQISAVPGSVLGEKLFRFLSTNADQIVDGLSLFAGRLRDSSLADGALFSTPIPVLGRSLGEIIDDSAQEVVLENLPGTPVEEQPILAVSSVFVADGFRQFVVTLADNNPATLGIQAGDPVVFEAESGNLVVGEVAQVDAADAIVRFDLGVAESPDRATPSLSFAIGGGLADQIQSLFGRLADPGELAATIPTLDGLIDTLAALTGVEEIANVSIDPTTFDVTIPLHFSLPPIEYARRLDFGDTIAGFEFDGSGDVQIQVTPTIDLVVGISLAPGLAPLDRLFIVEDADDPATGDFDETRDLVLDVTVALDEPQLSGRIGFLGVDLVETTPPIGEENDGIQLNLTMAVDLVEPDAPGLGAGDDRIVLDDFTLGNLLDAFQTQIDGFVDIDGLTLSASISGGPPFANVGLSLDGESGTSAPGHLESLDAADISELIAGFQVTGDLFGYQSFNNLSAGDLILLVNQLGHALNGMASGLNPPGGIPLVDKGIDAVADFGEMLAGFTADLINDDGTPKFTTFQELVPALADALGLDPAQIMPSYDPALNELKVKIQLAHAFAPEPVELDFNAGGGALQFTASADANFVVNANLGVTLGMRLGEGLDFEDRLFIQSGGALTLTGGIGASDIDLGASLGLLGVDVENGSIAISLGPQITLSDPAAVPDGRITLAELLDDPLGAIDAPTLVASVDGELPLVVTGLNLGIDPLNPPAIDISLATPNDLSSIQFVPNAAFDDLIADFADFDLEDVAAMIQSLVDLLQSADIGVFDRDLPLVNRSVNDLLGVVDNLAATVLELSQTFDLSQVLFGLTDLQLATAALPAGTDVEGLSGVITSLTDLLAGDAPETQKSALVAILAQLRTEIDALPGSVNKTSLNNAHASLDLATSSVQAIGRILSDALGIQAPSSLTIQLTDANPSPAVFERALVARLHLVKNVFNVARPIGFDVGQFGPIQISAGGDISLAVGGTLDLDIGYNLARRRAFLLESSQISATAQGAVNNLQVDVGIGGVTGSIDSGTIALGNGASPASIGVNVVGGDAFGAIYFGTDSDPATDDFDASNLSFAGVQGALTANLPLSVDLFGPVGTVQVAFDLATQNLTFQVPDVGAALSGGPFNFGLWVQGIDLVLAGIEAGLEGETLGKLPVIGDNLNLAGELVGDFRTNFLDPIQATIAGPTNLENRLKQVILDRLGGVAGGLGILRPAGTDCLAAMPAPITNVNLVDVDIDNVTGQAHINVHLCGQKSFASDFALDLGGVNLGIETSGGVNGSATYDIELGFGLSKTEGFFFTLDTQPGDPEEVELQISAFLNSGTMLDARMFFLDVEASDPTGSTGVVGGVTIDFLDPTAATPGKLTLSEIQGTPIGDLVDARVEAAADIRLHVAANAAIANDGFLPSIEADLFVDWNFSRTLGEPGSPSQLRPTFEVRDLTLSLGEFLSRVASPIAQKVNKYVEPVRPILDLLNSRIPGLAEAADTLGFGPRTWAEAISFFGGSGGETIERLINILTAVDNFVTDVVALNGQPIEINFGDFTFGNQDLRNGEPNLDAATPLDFIVAATGISPTVTSQAGAAGGILAAAAADPDNDDDGLGISFPILRNPANLLKMLFGQVVDLVVWDVKPLEFEFVVDQEWPILPPLPIFVGLGGVVSAKADFLVGFDTRGIKQTGRFFDGFYIGDTPGPEIELFAGVFGSLSVNLGVVEVGGEARLGADFNADWHDGNNDGKLYFDELVRQVSGGGLRCVFDFDGALTAMFNLFADPIGKGTDNRRIFPDPPVEVTLFQFPLPSCPALPPIDTAHHDFGRLPDEPASTPEREILVLNSGPFAPMREQATQRKKLDFLHPGVSETDEGETFTVRQTGPDTFEVTAYGVTQIFTGPKAILALAGDGNDTIVIDSSVTVPVYIEGGDDDDVLDGPAQSTVVGGDGDDFIPRKPIGGKGGKIVGGLGHDIVDIDPEFIPPAQPIDWTIEDGRYGFGTNPFDGDLLFDVDEFDITGTAAEDRFDIGNWSGVGTVRGDASDAIVDTRFNHTDFTLGNDSLSRGGGAGDIALDGIGRATLGNVGNDSQYNVHDAGFKGVATVNAGPGGHTFTSARDTDIALSDTAVSFGNGGAFQFAAAPIRNANFTGGAGANTYSLQNWNGTATIDGGGGHDRIAYRVSDGSSNAITAIGATTIARCFTTRCVPNTDVGGVIYSNIDEMELIGTPGVDNLSAGSAPFPVTIRGLGGNDIISGSAFDDSLFGEEGDDTINGVEGIDTIEGGEGNDTLIGFFELGGEDNLFGGPGIDRVSETRDNASWNLFNHVLSIDGEYTANLSGNDIEDAFLQGGPGVNQFVLTNWSGTATLEGFDGQDSIVDAHDMSFGLSDTLLTRSGLGSVTLIGIEGANLGTVSSTASQTFTDNGWHGSALFAPGGGFDTLVSQRNANFTLTASNYLPSDGGTFQLINGAFELAQLTGGAGANEFNVGGWIVDAIYDGGGGNDTLSYNTAAFNNSAATIAISNDSLDRSVLGIPRGKINFTSIETRNIIGSSAGDTIDASLATIGFSIDGAGGADMVTGGSGPDSLTGGAGNDTLIGNLGNDTLTGGADNDRYVYNAAWNGDTIVETAGQGTDTLDFAAVNGTSTISILTTGLNIAGSGSSVVYTGSSIEAIIGGLGNDSFNVSNGASLSGGAGTIDGGGGVNTLGYIPFTTPVTVNLNTGAATGFGGVANIQNVIGGTQGDSITGNGGANQLEGRDGNDTLVGLGGNDLLIDGTGSDSLDGGDGDDTFRIGHTSGATETIGDSSGSDTLDYSSSTGSRVIDLDNTATTQQVFTNQFLRINAGVAIENYLGSQGVDTLSLDPLERSTRNVVGNNPTGAPGDVLNYDGKNVPAVIAAGSVHSAGFRPVTFSLWETTNLANTLDPPPMVTAVRVGFANPAIPFFDIPVGTEAQLTPIPWTGVQKFQFVFSENVQFGEPTDLQVIGVANAYEVSASDFTYDSVTRTATWSLERSIALADKILLRMPSGRIVDFQGNDLDGEWQNPLPQPSAKGSVFPTGDIFPGGDFEFRLNVVPGDVNQNGTVDLADFHAQRSRQFRSQGDAAYDVLFDTDRSGHINVADGVLLLNHRGQSLPSGEPAPSPAATPAAAAADAVLARSARTEATKAPAPLVARRHDRVARRDLPIPSAVESTSQASESVLRVGATRKQSHAIRGRDAASDRALANIEPLVPRTLRR